MLSQNLVQIVCCILTQQEVRFRFRHVEGPVNLVTPELIKQSHLKNISVLIKFESSCQENTKILSKIKKRTNEIGTAYRGYKVKISFVTDLCREL